MDRDDNIYTWNHKSKHEIDKIEKGKVYIQ